MRGRDGGRRSLIPSTAKRTNASTSTTAPAAIRERPDCLERPSGSCPFCQPVSHHGTRPATTPGATTEEEPAPQRSPNAGVAHRSAAELPARADRDHRRVGRVAASAARPGAPPCATRRSRSSARRSARAGRSPSPCPARPGACCTRGLRETDRAAAAATSPRCRRRTAASCRRRRAGMSCRSARRDPRPTSRRSGGAGRRKRTPGSASLPYIVRPISVGAGRGGAVALAAAGREAVFADACRVRPAAGDPAAVDTAPRAQPA